MSEPSLIQRAGPSSEEPRASEEPRDRLTTADVAFTAMAWGLTIVWCGRQEAIRLFSAIESPGGIFGWFTDWNADTTFILLITVLLPAVIFCGRRLRAASGGRRQQRNRFLRLRLKFRAFLKSQAASVCMGLVSLFCSLTIGLEQIPLTQPVVRDADEIRFYQLPPAYHDEFSYLLQARTFLSGRVSWPRMTVQPDLFHQIHVLSEPTTASRYFPWTGLWMMPFVAMDNPYPGHWIAGALSCLIFHRALLRILPGGWAFVGGMLIAVSPGLAVFSNLLLAHHPTLLALSVFYWSFLRFMERQSVIFASLAGISLTLAMLGRPMTAAGFALPFGIWMIISLCRFGRSRDSQSFGNVPEPDRNSVPVRMLPLVAMGIPLFAGFVVLAWMNSKTTGDWRTSAYQFYTDTWTPRHRYGFNNAPEDPADRDSLSVHDLQAPRNVLRDYDRWAVNLTRQKAVENVGNRWVASLRWTSGIGLALLGLTAALPRIVSRSRADIRILLTAGSIFSLHIVHIPYWYDGIMHWHYVFETAPLLLILITVGLRNVAQCLRRVLSPAAASSWVMLMIAASLAPGWLDAPTLWGPSRVTQAIREQSFSRVRFELFRRLTSSVATSGPCLILVDERQSGQQLSYIVNSPDLSGDVLVCRLPQNVEIIHELQDAFADRRLWTFNPVTFELSEIAASP